MEFYALWEFFPITPHRIIAPIHMLGAHSRVVVRGCITHWEEGAHTENILTSECFFINEFLLTKLGGGKQNRSSIGLG